MLWIRSLCVYYLIYAVAVAASGNLTLTRLAGCLPLIVLSIGLLFHRRWGYYLLFLRGALSLLTAVLGIIGFAGSGFLGIGFGLLLGKGYGAEGLAGVLGILGLILFILNIGEGLLCLWLVRREGIKAAFGIESFSAPSLFQAVTIM